MISSFGAILAWKSDDDDAAADDDRKSDPYMSPSYAGDTKTKRFLSFWVVTHNKYYIKKLYFVFLFF